ncbi:MAG: hypothetical protein K0R65_1778 [Crocinitomicaceae bacterium]|nr:hypothetical protein [Crocinitomicaceae bacterium]
MIAVFLLAAVFIPAVPLCDWAVSFFYPVKTSPGAEISAKQLLAGISSESIRALITVYLYTLTAGKGASLAHGLKHGLLYSALIGSLYLILGAFYFQLSDPVRFLITDSVILLVQGAASGFVLYFVYRQS